MNDETLKGPDCAKCPVSLWECDAQYHGERCKGLINSVKQTGKEPDNVHT